MMQERDRIKQVRRLLGLSQQQMGELVGLKQGSYSDMERGKAAPGLALVRMLAERYRVSPLYLLLGQGPIFLDAAVAPVSGLRSVPYVAATRMPELAQLCHTPDWPARFPQLHLPGLGTDPHEQWLATDVVQDGMTPTLYPGDLVICRALPPTERIQDNRLYLLLLQDGAWAIKRVLNRLDRDGTLLLKSDNRGHATYPLPGHTLAQAWAVHRRLTAKLQGPDDLFDRLNALEQAVWDLQQQR